MSKISLKSVENRVSQILNDLNITELPIKLDLVAQSQGLNIVAHDLGNNVSGVLFIDKGQGTIGYNQDESDVRKKFTVAHEIGHYVLHRLNDELFIDQKQFNAIYRDQDSSTGEILQEREANTFAAALLMPKEILIEEIDNNTFDLSEGNTINKLADKFKVSTQAMTFRLANLNIF